MNLNCNAQTPNDDQIKTSLYQCVRSVRHMTEQLANIVSVLNDKTTNVHRRPSAEFVLHSSCSSSSPLSSSMCDSEVDSTSSDSSYCYDLYKVKCKHCLNNHKKPDNLQEPLKDHAVPKDSINSKDNSPSKDQSSLTKSLEKQDKSTDNYNQNPQSILHYNQLKGRSNLGSSEIEVNSDISQLRERNIENNRFSLPNHISVFDNFNIIKSQLGPKLDYKHSHQIPSHFVASRESDHPALRAELNKHPSQMTTKGFSMYFAQNDEPSKLDKHKSLVSFNDNENNETKLDSNDIDFNLKQITDYLLKDSKLKENLLEKINIIQAHQNNQSHHKNEVDSIITITGVTSDQVVTSSNGSTQMNVNLSLDNPRINSIPSMSGYTTELLKIGYDTNDADDDISLQSYIETKTNKHLSDNPLKIQITNSNYDLDAEYEVIIPDRTQPFNLNSNESNNYNYLTTDNYDLESFIDVCVQSMSETTLHTSHCINNHNNSKSSLSNFSDNNLIENQLNSESSTEISNHPRNECKNSENLKYESNAVKTNDEVKQIDIDDVISCYTINKKLKLKNRNKFKLESNANKSEKDNNSNGDELVDNDYKSIEGDVKTDDNEESLNIAKESQKINPQNPVKSFAKSIMSYEEFVCGSKKNYKSYQKTKIRSLV